MTGLSTQHRRDFIGFPIWLDQEIPMLVTYYSYGHTARMFGKSERMGCTGMAAIQAPRSYTRSDEKINQQKEWSGSGDLKTKSLWLSLALPTLQGRCVATNTGGITSTG
jgi:hypothetical protein